jgi:hypothetical protein
VAATSRAARSAVWRSAIDQRVATDHNAEAIGLLDRVKAELVPADQNALEKALAWTRVFGGFGFFASGAGSV